MDLSTVLSLDQLLFFHLVATEGSIKAASEKLHVTQPAVSIRIKNLESQLASRLFKRESRGLKLTPQGEMLRTYTEKIFELTEDAYRSISGTLVKNPKIKRVGYVPSISKSFLHDILKPFWEEDWRLNVWHGHDEDLYTQLESSKVDMVIVDREPKYLRSHWKVRPVHQRRMIFAASEKYAALKRNFPYSLEGIPFISFSERNPLRYEVDRFLNRHMVQPRVIGEIDDFGLLKSFLIDGTSVGVLSERALHESGQESRLRILGELKGVVSKLWVIESGERK